jgi:hypothetical protein
LAAGYLKDAARDWFQSDRTNITRWHAGAAGDFDTRFLNYFATNARKNQWTRELHNIKQKEREKVEDYARKFKKLLRKAIYGNVLAARYQVDYFVNGLNYILVSQTMMADLADLEAAITRAKLVEMGVQYIMQNMVPQVFQNTVQTS